MAKNKPVPYFVPAACTKYDELRADEACGEHGGYFEDMTFRCTGAYETASYVSIDTDRCPACEGVVIYDETLPRWYDDKADIHGRLRCEACHRPLRER